MVARWQMDRLRQQPGGGPRPQQQHRRLCRRSEGRIGRQKAHHLDRSRRRATSPGRPIRSRSPTPRARSSSCWSTRRPSPRSSRSTARSAIPRRSSIARVATHLLARRHISAISSPMIAIEYPAEVELIRRRRSSGCSTQQGAVMTLGCGGGHTAVLYTNDTAPRRDLRARKWRAAQAHHAQRRADRRTEPRPH